MASSMESAILVHGKIEPASNGESTGRAADYMWFPLLRSILQTHNVPSVAPDFPGGCEPEYRLWEAIFDSRPITEQTKLIGHSVGAGFIVRWLSEHPDVRVGNVVLVAPSLGLNWTDRTFFDFTFDRQLCNRADSIAVFGSDDDSSGIQLANHLLRDNLPDARFYQCANLGHFSLRRMTQIVMQAMVDELLPGSGVIIPESFKHDWTIAQRSAAETNLCLQPA